MGWHYEGYDKDKVEREAVERYDAMEARYGKTVMWLLTFGVPAAWLALQLYNRI